MTPKPPIKLRIIIFLTFYYCFCIWFFFHNSLMCVCALFGIYEVIAMHVFHIFGRCILGVGFKAPITVKQNDKKRETRKSGIIQSTTKIKNREIRRGSCKDPGPLSLITVISFTPQSFFTNDTEKRRS